MNCKQHNSAFSLIELMIVISLIGLLAAIAIPNFIRARTTAMQNACIQNLRIVDAAKQQWALETHQGAAALPTAEDIGPYIGRAGNVSNVTCPSGGVTATFASSYAINGLTNAPTCLVVPETHLLP